MKRIKDKKTAADLPTVIYRPFLRSPTEIFSTGKCVGSYSCCSYHINCFCDIQGWMSRAGELTDTSVSPCMVILKNKQKSKNEKILKTQDMD